MTSLAVHMCFGHSLRAKDLLQKYAVDALGLVLQGSQGHRLGGYSPSKPAGSPGDLVANQVSSPPLGPSRSSGPIKIPYAQGEKMIMPFAHGQIAPVIEDAAGRLQSGSLPAAASSLGPGKRLPSTTTQVQL